MAEESLARIQGTSVPELVDMADSIQDYLRADTSSAQQAALDRLEKRKGLLARLVPTPLERELREIDLRTIRSAAQVREQLFTAYSESQIEIARQKADIVVKAHGMHARKLLTAFATDIINQMTATINSSRSRFLASYGPHEDEIETYQNRPELYKRARKSLIKEMETYFDTLDKLLDGFVQALDAKASSL